MSVLSSNPHSLAAQVGKRYGSVEDLIELQRDRILAIEMERIQREEGVKADEARARRSMARVPYWTPLADYAVQVRTELRRSEKKAWWHWW